MLLFIGLGPMEKGDAICCAACSSPLASVVDICRVLDRPPRTTYVNPHGLLCPILTLSEVSGLEPGEITSTENTWFEGYAWTPVSCGACDLFLGWRFEAVAGGRPPIFFGLLEERLITRPAEGPAVM